MPSHPAASNSYSLHTAFRRSKPQRHLRSEFALTSSVEAPEAVGIKYQVGVSAFDPEQLSHIANMMPSLNCECPNHIAKLLIDINGFEKYCMQCVDDDPSQKRPARPTGRYDSSCTLNFEAALRSVALADGLDLESMPGQTKH